MPGPLPAGRSGPSLTFSTADVRRRRLQHPLQLGKRQLRKVEQRPVALQERAHYGEVGARTRAARRSHRGRRCCRRRRHFELEDGGGGDGGGVEGVGCRGMAGQPYEQQEALVSGRPCGSERLRHRAAIPQYNGCSEQSRTESDGGKRGALCLSLSALFPPLLPSVPPSLRLLRPSHLGFATASCDRGNENKGSGAGRRTGR